MNERKSPVFYRTLSPLGLLPCLSFQFTTMQSRATGIADHILPLGDLLVACYATLHPAMSVRWLVGWLVGLSLLGSGPEGDEVL